MASRSHRARLRLLIVVGAFAALTAFAPAASASPSSAISFTKTCGDWCTVANSSNTSLIPNGSTLTYVGPRFDPHLSSGFILDTGTGSAVGHCQLNWATGTGSCVVERGSGSLAGIHAVFSEWVDFADGNFSNFVFHLDGSYHVG